MRIAARAGLGGTSASVPSAERMPRASLSPRADDRVGLPATAVAQRYGKDLLAIPGAQALNWGSAEPSLLHVDFGDEASARIAAGLFETSIDGVRVVARVGERVVELPEHENAGSASDRVRAVSAMHGVWSSRFADTSQYQHGQVTFSTIDQATIDRLDPILRDRISLGWMPETFEPRFLVLTWTAGVPGATG